jgi:hypothetical protein
MGRVFGLGYGFSRSVTNGLVGWLYVPHDLFCYSMGGWSFNSFSSVIYESVEES